MLLLVTHMVLFWEIQVFLPGSWLRKCASKWAFLNFEIEICRKYSFQKLTQFSLARNMLDAPASNTVGFFRDVHAFLHLIWTKGAFLDLKNIDKQEVVLPKTNSILTEKQCARCCSFSHRWISLERCMCSSTHANMPNWNKGNLSPLCKTQFAGNFPLINSLNFERKTMR
jgi:hypothetical protein